MSTDKVILSWKIAEKYHREQEYVKGKSGNKGITYLYHLGQVFIEASLSIKYEDEIDRELLLLSAIMHDLIEDTDVDFEFLLKEFGFKVIASIKALTKNEALPKESQMEDSLNRILLVSKETAMVKLCDRIANLSRRPPSHWKVEWILKYAKEAEYINHKLGWSSKYLSDRLESKILFYKENYT